MLADRTCSWTSRVISGLWPSDVYKQNHQNHLRIEAALTHQFLANQLLENDTQGRTEQ